MKTVTLEKIGQLRIEEKPIPTLDAGDVLIQMELCGICASDLAALRGDVSDYAPPVVMGHELAGVIVESLHPDVKTGEKVTVNPMLSCGSCLRCQNDQDKYCDTIEGIGHDIDGGYAEYIRMPKHGVDTGKLIRVPETIPPEELLFLEPLGCCINAMQETFGSGARLESAPTVGVGARLESAPTVGVARLESSPTVGVGARVESSPTVGRGVRVESTPTDGVESVAILGAGPIGLMLTQLAKRRGLATYVLEPLAHRRTVAEQVGANATFGVSTDAVAHLRDITHGGVDTVISATTNNASAISLAFDVVRRGGCINLFGLAPEGEELRINLEQFHYDGHKLMASWAFSRASLAEARQLLIEKALDFSPLLTARFPIESGLEAFENAAAHRGVKTALHP